MKYPGALGLPAMLTVVIAAFTAGTASATTLEVNGAAQNQSVAISMSLESETSLFLQLTNGSFANTCTKSTVSGTTSTFSAESSKPIGGPIGALSFTSCTTSPIVVDKAGSLSVEWINGTTNGTVRSVGAEVTVPSPIGNLSCKTGSGVDIGTLTGKATGGTATIDINAVLNCGFLLPSSVWGGVYVVTSPTGFGIAR